MPPGRDGPNFNRSLGMMSVQYCSPRFLLDVAPAMPISVLGCSVLRVAIHVMKVTDRGRKIQQYFARGAQSEYRKLRALRSTRRFEPPSTFGATKTQNMLSVTNQE